jgi:hypothetical protein
MYIQIKLQFIKGGNQDCELPDFVHTKIVEDAVNLLLLSLSKLSTNNNSN